MTTKPATLIALSAGGAVLAAVTSYLGVVSPQLQARADNLSQAQMALTQAQAQRAKAGELEAKATVIDSVVDDVNRLVRQFPHAYEQGEWLAMVQAAAKRTGVTFKSIIPNVPVDPARIDPVTGMVLAEAPTTSAPTGSGVVSDEAETEAGIVDGNEQVGVIGADDPGSGVVGAGDAGTGDAAAAEPAPEFPVARSDVSLMANGTAGELVAFLAALEEMERPMLVDEVKLAGQDDLLQMTLSARTFLVRPLEVPEQFADGQ